jgi:hypothetical protein
MDFVSPEILELRFGGMEDPMAVLKIYSEILCPIG